MLRTLLRRLPEDLLHLHIVLQVPLDLCLPHQSGHLPLQRLVVVLQRLLYGVVVPLHACFLDLLRDLAQHVHVILAQVLEASVRLLRAVLLQDQSVQILLFVLGEALECQVSVFGQYICCQVLLQVFALQEQQVCECLRWEGRVVEQEVEFPEGGCGVVVHVDECLVVQRYRVQFFLLARGHVEQSLLCPGHVLEVVLDGCLQVERLDEGSLTQHLRVAHAHDIHALCIRPHPQFRVLAHSVVDDFRYDLQRLRILLQFVLTQRNVLRQLALLAQGLHGILELLDGVFLQLSLLEDASFVDPCVGLIWGCLYQQRPSNTGVVLLLLYHRLKC